MFSRSYLAPSLILVFSVLLTTSCKTEHAATRPAPPPVPVSLAQASQRTVPFDVRVVGTVEASAIVQVKSQVAGELMTVHFTEGQNVKKGDLLFEIDARPYREALRQAESAVARDRAQLKQSEAALARDQAQLRNSESESTRNAELLKAGVISRSQADQARTTAEVGRESVRAGQAAIESARAALETDLAAVDKSKLDISYCSIYAPISGRTGNLLVNAGNLVKANGDSPMVVIHQLSPIYVSFNLPEQHLATVRRLNSQHALPLRVITQTDSARAVTGQLRVVDNTVDSTTGTIHLKGELANTDAYLWPGQFVNVVLTLGNTQNATVVPAEAVQSGQNGDFVYVVKSDQTVEPRVIQTGRALERTMIVEKGIAPGETVVVDGQLRLFPGARIRAVDPRKIEGMKL